ncbi:hypothetical protein AC062_2454 [Pasteurellaceae bacterium NI1060]|nr:hypothetical protein AC062_2454 [Pasteurellaceae bacterium NI1060]
MIRSIWDKRAVNFHLIFSIQYIKKGRQRGVPPSFRHNV